MMNRIFSPVELIDLDVEQAPESPQPPASITAEPQAPDAASPLQDDSAAARPVPSRIPADAEAAPPPAATRAARLAALRWHRPVAPPAPAAVRGAPLPARLRRPDERLLLIGALCGVCLASLVGSLLYFGYWTRLQQPSPRSAICCCWSACAASGRRFRVLCPLRSPRRRSCRAPLPRRPPATRGCRLRPRRRPGSASSPRCHRPLPLHPGCSPCPSAPVWPPAHHRLPERPPSRPPEAPPPRRGRRLPCPSWSAWWLEPAGAHRPSSWWAAVR